MGKPWEDAPEVWKDEGAFCQWLRSQSRRMWSRHPVKNNYTRARMVPVEDVPVALLAGAPHRSTKALCQCEMCGLYFPRNKMEVDHIVQAGSFKTVDDWQGFLQRLMVVGYDDIRLLCKTKCHPLVTLSQRYHCSIEEALIYSEVAQFKKLTASEQKGLMAKLQLPVLTTGRARATAYLEYMLKELHQ